jgi:hypothetical protein
MELPVQPSRQPSKGRSYEAPPWCYLLWGVPAIIIVGADLAYQDFLLSATATGALWVLSVAWIGAGCFINGRSCGRVHCKIDGIAFPVLTFIGVLNLLSIISFDWSFFLLAFLIVLVASFVPELTWKRYS